MNTYYWCVFGISNISSVQRTVFFSIWSNKHPNSKIPVLSWEEGIGFNFYRSNIVNLYRHSIATCHHLLIKDCFCRTSFVNTQLYSVRNSIVLVVDRAILPDETFWSALSVSISDNAPNSTGRIARLNSCEINQDGEFVLYWMLILVVWSHHFHLQYSEH